MSSIYIYINYKNKVIDDTVYELIMVAKKINSNSSVIGIVFGSGEELESICKQTSLFCDKVWFFDNVGLFHPNGEVIRQALKNGLNKKSILILPHTTIGMDFAPGLSINLNAPYLSDIIDIREVSNDSIKVVRQEFGGMVHTKVECSLSSGLVMTVRPGAFHSDEPNFVKVDGEIIDKSFLFNEVKTNRKFIEIIEPEVGDVDITKSDVLVSIGRGIEEEDNIEIAEELANALGSVVSCSRPIVDAKWMSKSRQVGTSGQTVKPKIYIACGISGSFQHMGGIKGSPFIIAINKNKKAPIFQVADIGVEADILDFMPQLTEKINEL